MLNVWCLLVLVSKIFIEILYFKIKIWTLLLPHYTIYLINPKRIEIKYWLNDIETVKYLFLFYALSKHQYLSI